MQYNRNARFVWDENKNQTNLEKHGVRFEEAQTLWLDPLAQEFFDPDHNETEDRFLKVGYSGFHRILLVAFCERADDWVRIISARRATIKEIHDYEEGI